MKRSGQDMDRRSFITGGLVLAAAVVAPALIATDEVLAATHPDRSILVMWDWRSRPKVAATGFEGVHLTLLPPLSGQTRGQRMQIRWESITGTAPAGITIANAELHRISYERAVPGSVVVLVPPLVGGARLTAFMIKAL